MKPIVLLESLGNVKDTYVISAEEFRQGKQRTPVKQLGAKRFWLIAAAIALTLLLVGCAAVYVLRLQNMKVGDYSYTLPAYYDEDGNIIYAYDEDGNIITQQTMPPISLISLQGANMEAMTEWLAFTDSYDPDGTIMIEADKSGSAWELPEQYHLTYRCYSQEMVDKLDEIVEKYDLNLLSTAVDLQYYESSVLFDALGVDVVFQLDAPVEIEYGSSYFYPEGTFDFDFLLSADAGNWQCKENSASYRYSLKEYFDPVTGSYESGKDTQWNYTRKDGTNVLLVQNNQWAHIYADLPDAFVSVLFEPVVLVDGVETAMTQADVEQVAEWIDLSIQPQPADMAKVQQLKAEAAAQHEAEWAAAKEAQYSNGYAAYIQKQLDFYPEGSRMRDNLSYALYDINGDGIEELITHSGILSMKNGESYSYFIPMLPTVNICQDGVIEVSDYFSDTRYYFQAGDTGTTYLVGLEQQREGEWYLLPEFPAADPAARVRQKTDAQRVQEIVDSHPRIELQWQLMKRFGQPVVTKTYTDPYAAYIAKQLDRYDDAKTYTYALMDLDGNGVDELICRDVWTSHNGQTEYILSIHTIVNGELSNMGMDLGFNYVCEDGVLEESEEESGGGAYYQYYKIENGTAVKTDKIVQDRSTRYWGLGKDGAECKTVWEEEARAVIASHKRIELDMKPFTAYPLK